MATVVTAATKVARRGSQDYLVTNADGIEGSKLPSVEQVLSYFLHRHNVLKEDIRTAANNSIKRVEDFWLRAKIPVKHRQDSVKKLEGLFYQWKGLKKNKNRKTQTQQANEVMFTEMIKELFDIAHADAMTLLENEEDKLFLESQWKKGRPGCMVGVHNVLLRQQQQQKEKEEKLQRRRKRSEHETELLSQMVELESSSNNSDLETTSSDSDNQDPVPTTSTADPPPRK